MSGNTPGYLIAMLTAYGTPNPINDELAQQLLSEGMITAWKEDSYTATDKGSKFVRMLCAVPLPVHKWVDPREKE
jgi:hypothetical protein